MKNTKRFMALLLTLVLVFGSMSSAFAAVNEDVVDTDFEVAVGKLSALGIMEGYPDGTFRPEGQITRAEFAKIAVLALGLNDAAEVSKSNTIFTDVNAFHWAAGYINVAVDRGILKGYPDGSYKPSNPLSNAEAITILTRLIGLAPVVDKEGTWPANYITRANLEGVLDDVVVSSTSNATRGNAAKMLVNTLTIQKWGATGYDNDGSVNYGQLNTTLLTENLGIVVYGDDKDEVARVTEEDADDATVELSISVDGDEFDDGDDDYEMVEEFDVAEDVNLDFYDMLMNEVEAWVVADDDEIIYAEIKSDYFIDAITFDTDSTDEEVDLKIADESFDIEEHAVIVIHNDDEDDNDVVDFDELDTLNDMKFDLAKVVLDDKNDVVYIDAYDFDDMTVVQSVEEDDEDEFYVVALDGEEFEFDGYTFFKDGMYIAIEDLEENDVVMFNDEIEYAEVYNATFSGEITKIMDKHFDVDDEEYSYFNDEVLGGENAVYLDGDEFAAFDEDGAEKMEDTEESVTVFTDRFGDLLYVTGELGDPDENTVAGLLLESISFDDYFESIYAEFVFINENAVKVTERVKLKDFKIDGTKRTIPIADDSATTQGPVDDSIDAAKELFELTDNDVATTGDIIEFVYDDEGDIVGINVENRQFTEARQKANDDEKIASDEGYQDGFKLLSDTVIFNIPEDFFTDNSTFAARDGKTIDADDVEVLEFADLDFDIIDDFEYYVSAADKVLYIATDSASIDTEDVVAFVDASSVRTKQAGDAADEGDIVRLTAWTQDGKKTYTVDEVDIVANNLDDIKTLDDAYTLVIEKDTDLVVDIEDNIDRAGQRSMATETIIKNSVDISGGEVTLSELPGVDSDNDGTPNETDVIYYVTSDTLVLLDDDGDISIEKLRDIDENDYVYAYTYENRRHAQVLYISRGAELEEIEDVAVDGTLAYVSTSDKELQIGTKVYDVVGSAVAILQQMETAGLNLFNSSGLANTAGGNVDVKLTLDSNGDVIGFEDIVVTFKTASVFTESLNNINGITRMILAEGVTGLALTYDGTVAGNVDQLADVNLNGGTVASIDYTSDASGTMTFANGTVGTVATPGNLTVDAENATVNNSLTVAGTGSVVITDVASSTWNEKASGNTLVVAKNTIKPAKVITLNITGTVASLEVNQPANITGAAEVTKLTVKADGVKVDELPTEVVYDGATELEVGGTETAGVLAGSTVTPLDADIMTTSSAAITVELLDLDNEPLTGMASDFVVTAKADDSGLNAEISAVTESSTDGTYEFTVTGNEDAEVVTVTIKVKGVKLTKEPVITIEE